MRHPPRAGAGGMAGRGVGASPPRQAALESQGREGPDPMVVPLRPNDSVPPVLAVVVVVEVGAVGVPRADDEDACAALRLRLAPPRHPLELGQQARLTRRRIL